MTSTFGYLLLLAGVMLLGTAPYAGYALVAGAIMIAGGKIGDAIEELKRK